MMQLLREHPGRHLDPATLSALHLFFRRALRLPWRKAAAPASRPGAGAAAAAGRYECCWHCRSGYPCDPRDAHRDPCDFGCNDEPDGAVCAGGVLGTRTISEVRAEEEEAARRARQHADVMHAGYAQAVDRLRADAGLPVAGEMRQEYFRLPQRADETLTDLPVARPYVPQPVYGETSVADVLEAERLNQVMTP